MCWVRWEVLTWDVGPPAANSLCFIRCERRQLCHSTDYGFTAALLATMGTLTPKLRQQIFTLSSSVSVEELMRRFTCSRNTIEHWIAEGRKGHKAHWADAPRSGRPRVTTSPQRKAMKQQGQRKHSTRQIAHTNGVSKSTVSRIMRSGRKPLPYLAVVRASSTLRKGNNAWRLKWCQRHQHLSSAKLVFVDAAFVACRSDPTSGARCMRQHRGERERYAKTPTQVPLCMYGAIAKGWRSPLYFVPPPSGWKADDGSRISFTAKFFTNHVLPQLKKDMATLPGYGRSYRIVWDNAKQHVAKTTQAKLAQLNLKLLEGFPSQSWDLNVIEKAWGMMADARQGVHMGRPPTTEKAFRARELRLWEGLSTDQLDRLVASMPEHIKECIRNKGEWPKK